MSKYEKILHWLILLAFLGLCTTALAAEYFFSKEALLESFKKSLPMINIVIPPVDQFFMSRIARRDTWDIHLYFGILFSFLLVIWIGISLVRNNRRYVFLKTIFLLSTFTFSISGIWMWLRLYIDVSEETFGLLKKVHYYAYWIFIYTLISHIIMIIWMENSKKKGVLSNMFNFKSIAIVALLYGIISSQSLYANEFKTDLDKWSNDSKYIDGVLFIEGDKGADVLLKEISNCPYEKCKMEDIDQTQFGTKVIEIKKPDFKKGISLLEESSDGGNALASEKLLKFLTQRIDYKSKNPSGYLVSLLHEETGLSLNDYKKLINKTWKNGVKTEKSCFSEFLAAEIKENGLLDNSKDTEIAKKYYERALSICPKSNINFHLATSKLTNLNKK